MTPATVVDTGPLVALLNRNDSHHRRCVELFASLTVTPLVPTTVIVEVCWLLEEQPDVEAEFLDAVADGAFTLVSIMTADLARMAELVRQYADFPLGAVDASVVAVAERLDLHEVVTAATSGSSDPATSPRSRCCPSSWRSRGRSVCPRLELLSTVKVNALLTATGQNRSSRFIEQVEAADPTATLADPRTNIRRSRAPRSGGGNAQIDR